MAIRTLFISVLVLMLVGCKGATGTADAESSASPSKSEYYKKLDSAKFALTVRFHVKGEHLGDFRTAIRSRVLAVRQDEAAIDFRVFATEDPHVFVVFESFPSRAAWTAFAKTRTSVAFLTSIEHMYASPYQLQFLDLIER